MKDYSPFQKFVIDLIEKFPIFIPVQDPNFKSYDVFYIKQWSNVEELITVWFDWINKNVSWYHDLPPDVAIYLPKYYKQDYFRDALNIAYQFEELYKKEIYLDRLT